MQAPDITLAGAAGAKAAAADRPPDRYVVRPAGVLADILGSAEFGEAELLLRLRELGLITYPSPLLGGLLERLPEVLVAEVLAQLDPTDMVVFGQVGRGCRAAVVAFGVPQEEEVEGWSDDSDDEGTQGGPLLLRVGNFVGSIERLAWAKAGGCPWDESTCALAAEGGHLEVLQWAREHGCDWTEHTCFGAARGGYLDVLRWAHEHGCPWSASTCANAALGGYLHVLQYARENGCPWDSWTCTYAAMYGQLEVLKWAREHHCPWTKDTGYYAAAHGHLDVLRWAREHGCPWTAATRDRAATKGYSDNLPLAASPSPSSSSDDSSSDDDP